MCRSGCETDLPHNGLYLTKTEWVRPVSMHGKEKIETVCKHNQARNTMH